MQICITCVHLLDYLKQIFIYSWKIISKTHVLYTIIYMQVWIWFIFFIELNCLLKTIKVDNDKERQNKRFYTVFCKCLQLLYLESHNCCFVFQMPVLCTVTLIAPVYSKHHRMAIVPSPEILWKKVTIVVCH